jgi:hypothetical protein
MPQQESNMDNIRAFADIAIGMRNVNSHLQYTGDEEVNGLLLTLWDDDSPHFELYKRGILAFAEYTWSGDIRSKEELKAAYRQREYGSALAGEEFAFVEMLEEAVEWWTGALLKDRNPNFIHDLADPTQEVIDLPFSGDQGEWMSKHSDRLVGAAMTVRNCNRIDPIIDTMKNLAIRNTYRLEVYEQVSRLVRFSGETLMNLQFYDMATAGREKEEALARLKLLPQEFEALRKEFEEVYGRTRIMHKPDDYILDQDHHRHMANQSLNYDWQFWGEIFFLEKLEQELKNFQQ